MRPEGYNNVKSPAGAAISSGASSIRRAGTAGAETGEPRASADAAPDERLMG